MPIKLVRSKTAMKTNMAACRAVKRYESRVRKCADAAPAHAIAAKATNHTNRGNAFPYAIAAVTTIGESVIANAEMFIMPSSICRETLLWQLVFFSSKMYDEPHSMASRAWRIISETSLHALVFSPLVFVSGVLFPSVMPRASWMYFWLCVLIIFAFASAKRETRYTITVLDFIFFIFIATLTLASIFGASFVHSLWGEEGRSMGLAFILLFAAAWFAMRSLQFSSVEMNRVWKSAAIVLFLSAIIGIWQKFDPFLLPSSNGDRIGGILGNAMVFASYLLPNAFLMIALAARKESARMSFFWTRFFLPLTAALATIVIFLSQTRAAILGLLAGAFVAIVGYVLFERGQSGAKRARKFVAIAGVILLIAFGAAAIIARTTRNPLLERLTFSTSQSFTLQTRLIDWRMGWEAFKTRPWLGYGWENYRHAIEPHFNPELVKYSLGETRLDKPHNIFVEIAVTAGAVGLFVYLIFILTILFALRRAVHTGALSVGSAWCLCGAIIAYLTAMFFGFDTHTTLWTLGLIMLWIADSARPIAAFSLSWFKGGVRWLIVVFLIFGAILFVRYAAYLPMKNGYYITRALDALALHDTETVLREVATIRAIDSGPYEFENWRWSAQATLFDFVSGKRKSVELPNDLYAQWFATVQEIAKDTDRFMKKYAKDAQWQLFGGKIALQSALATNDRAYLEVAADAFQRAHELSPSRQEPLLLGGQVAMFKENFSEAVRLTKSALTLPFEESTNAIEPLANALIAEKQWPLLVELYEFLAEKFNTAEWYARLAAAYEQSAKYRDARAAVLRAVELDQNYASDAELFIQRLPKK